MELRFFDPRDEIENLEGNLPHWRQGAVLYFVTFRAADALPAEKLRLWAEEKQGWLASHPEPWDAPTHEEYFEQFPRRIQRWLDAGEGECFLAQERIRTVVEGTLRHFDGTRYALDEFVVASNHVHVLVTPASGVELSRILHSWKSYSAKAINRVANRNGAFWQQESYDHIVRSEDALFRIRNYIRNHRRS
jgi:REP element-mobilizing transposase RayT